MYKLLYKICWAIPHVSVTNKYKWNFCTSIYSYSLPFLLLLCLLESLDCQPLLWPLDVKLLPRSSNSSEGGTAKNLFSFVKDKLFFSSAAASILNLVAIQNFAWRTWVLLPWNQSHQWFVSAGGWGAVVELFYILMSGGSSHCPLIVPIILMAYGGSMWLDIKKPTFHAQLQIFILIIWSIIT